MNLPRYFRIILFSSFILGIIFSLPSTPVTKIPSIGNSSSPFIILKNDSINNFVPTSKHKGAHVFGITDTTNLTSISDNNIEWITLVPWGYQYDYNSPLISHHNGDSLEIKKGDEHWLAYINHVQDQGFKVFVKPHVWLSHPSNGTWRSDIFPRNEQEWQLWQASYRDFIFRYARIAEKAGAEMFCIGTEFTRLSLEKPQFWFDLIKDLREIFSGEITYAANWYKEFEDITFWSELDFIGIQAYFPLTKTKNPSVSQISKGWNKYLPAMKNTSEQFDRKILFTEMGYKSTSDSAIQPWDWLEHPENRNKSLSIQTQANCYKSFFDKVWDRDWFAGVHIWQYRIGIKPDKAKNNRNFSPQGKPAEDIIAKAFE